MRAHLAFFVSIVLAGSGCSGGGSSNSSPDGGSSNSSPDGGSSNSNPEGGSNNSSPDGSSSLASSDKDKCELYLACLNVANQAAYANQLALYGDSSACWQDSTTSANCASACVTAYDQIESDCNCTSTTSCLLCTSTNVPATTTAYKAIPSPGSCFASALDEYEFYVHSNADGTVSFGTGDLTVLAFLVDVETVSPMSCNGVSMLSWSGMNESDTQCDGTLTASGTLTVDGGGALSLTLSFAVTSEMPTTLCDTELPPVGSSCAGMFALTPEN